MSALVPTPAAVTWPAAVSPLVADVVHGAPRPRRVLGAFPTCLYVELGRHDRVLAVYTPDAVPLPIGLRLTVSVRLDHTARPGDLVTVGGGRVRLPGADVFAVRSSRPSRVEAVGATASPASRSLLLLTAGARADLGGFDAAAYHLCVAALTGGPVEACVDRLVGAGGGLTPSGDDLLCGILLTLRAFERGTPRALGSVQEAVRARLHRTTSISAALIAAATQGWATPDVVRLLALLGGCRPAHGGEVGEVRQRVLAIGHTSGADLLAGVTGTLTALSLVESISETASLEARKRQLEAVDA